MTPMAFGGLADGGGQRPAGGNSNNPQNKVALLLILIPLGLIIGLTARLALKRKNY